MFILLVLMDNLALEVCHGSRCLSMHQCHEIVTRRKLLNDCLQKPRNTGQLCAVALAGGTQGPMNTIPRKDELVALLNALKQRHRDLDIAIDSLERSGTSDQLQLRRLKKEKLALKDRISRIEDQILPDIIA
jgi:hypothetical protein